MPTACKHVLAVAVVITLAGCSRSEDGAPTPTPLGETTVRVENQNWLDMTVYALRGTQRVRLGTVTAQTTRIFVLPASLAAARSVEFIADPIGSSETARSFELLFDPGDAIELVITN